MKKIEKIKKLNKKGMTLIEVIASMAILAIVSLVIYNGADSILRGLEIGQFVYESNGVIEERLEKKTDSGSDGKVTFTFNVNGSTKTVEVNGQYHTDSITEEDKTISYTLFRP